MHWKTPQSLRDSVSKNPNSTWGGGAVLPLLKRPEGKLNEPNFLVTPITIQYSSNDKIAKYQNYNFDFLFLECATMKDEKKCDLSQDNMYKIICWVRVLCFKPGCLFISHFKRVLPKTVFLRKKIIIPYISLKIQYLAFRFVTYLKLISDQNY